MPLNFNVLNIATMTIFNASPPLISAYFYKAIELVKLNIC